MIVKPEPPCNLLQRSRPPVRVPCSTPGGKLAGKPFDRRKRQLVSRPAPAHRMRRLDRWFAGDRPQRPELGLRRLLCRRALATVRHTARHAGHVPAREPPAILLPGVSERERPTPLVIGDR